MALGSGYNGGNGNQSNNNTNYEPRYYSRLRLRNYDTHMGIDISYSGGLMKIDIVKGSGESRMEAAASVYLTGIKAMMLYNQMMAFNQRYIEDDKKLTQNMAFGVQTGMSEITTICAVHKNPDGQRALTIAKINASGSFTERTTFDFPKENLFGIEWSNFDQMKFDKKFESNIEFDMLAEAIHQFASTFSGAAGYNILDLNRYESNRQNSTIRRIAEKVGVEINNNRNNYSRGSNNYFNSNSDRATSTHRTAEEIDSLIDSDD